MECSVAWPWVVEESRLTYMELVMMMLMRYIMESLSALSPLAYPCTVVLYILNAVARVRTGVWEPGEVFPLAKNIVGRHLLSVNTALCVGADPS
jgi:hypothetical protein